MKIFLFQNLLNEGHLKSTDFIAVHTNFPTKSIANTVTLLTADATIPFIARYRKELTGNLDEVEIEKISGLLKEFNDLEKRKQTILKAINEQKGLTEELKRVIEKTANLTELEDIYLPFKKKRRTKADIAREAGLEPLAKMILFQPDKDLESQAKQFVKNDIETAKVALEGAKFIVAEWVNENQVIRRKLRRLYSQTAIISSKVVKEHSDNPEAEKYKQYFKWEEPFKRIPSHRFLAIFRARNEGFVRVKVEVDQDKALTIIRDKYLKNLREQNHSFLLEAFGDSFTRLLKPSFQSEFITEGKNKADKEAISVFADNLEQLLLSPPLGEKRILAIDPGFRSGCKVVCLDENGALLHNENIYPHPPKKEAAMAGKKIRSLINSYKIEAIAIGNGTASRETEFFIKKLPMEKDVQVFVVNEAGASVYSASKIAREEFPQYDITVRGAVSIGRRLSDPLAEFVKIDPKSIGIGQYQHEVDQSQLKEKLDNVVSKCVNMVGINVNTASRELLAYVSGIGPSLADNILDYRKEVGEIKTRDELTQIPRLGAKAFEQSAGFLRIINGKNPLDNSAVHPESYSVVRKMARDKGLKVEDLIGNSEVINTISTEKYINKGLGLPTIKDILKELEKPGSDPRKSINNFEFDPSVRKIEDLHQGMQLPGIVNNITNFGCFVDIGLKESGLIHISKLAKGFVSDVNSIVKLNQQLLVTVVKVDVETKRIQLSLID